MGAGTAMALLRGLHLAAMLSLLGTAGFVAWMLPAASAVPERLQRRLRRLGWISAAVALLAGVAWFVLQAAAIADADTPSDALAALPLVAAHTRYGTILMLRLGLLLALLVLAAADTTKSFAAGPMHQERAPARTVTRYVTLLLAAVALSLEGLIGHAGATGDGLVLSESLHLIAAGIWLGALLPLWLSLRMLPPAQAAAVCERFSPIGLACVLVLAGTGFAQGLQLIATVPALFGTSYGHIALLKIALFLLALLLAALNRLWLTDRLADQAAGARRHLLVSVGVETAIGLAIITAASFLASAPPAAHTTPVWPFSWRFSLVTVNEDADFRREVLVSLASVGAALVLTIAALLARRFRLVALAVLLLVVLLRGPSFRLLLVEAYPTSFQTSPTGFAAASIVRGQALFARNCVACHGTEGAGDGPAAASLHIRPADLTQPHIWEHSDGEMFWFLTHGVDDPEGAQGAVMAMPGFGATLSEDDRWALIDYVRAHNAGLGARRDGNFAVPVQLPAITVTCAGLTASRMADLHGHVVHIVAGAAVRDEIPPQSGVSTIDLALRDGGGPEAASCVAADPAAWAAYAVLAGVSPDRLDGAEFLADPNGWLRAMRLAGAAGAWHTTDELIAAVRFIAAHPIRQPGGGAHEHHH